MKNLILLILAIGLYKSGIAQTLEQRQLDSIPQFLSDDYGFFLGSYAEGIYVHQATTSGFSIHDKVLAAFDGVPFQQTQYLLNGFNVTDALLPGTALYDFPLNGYDLQLQPIDATIAFERKHLFPQFYFQVQTGHLGGRFPGADGISRFIYGHKNAFDRKILDFTERNRAHYNIDMGFDWADKKNEMQKWTNRFIGTIASRNIADFNFAGVRGAYNNAFWKLQNDFELLHTKSSTSVLAKLSYNDAYFVERGFQERAQAKSHEQVVTVFNKRSSARLDLNFGINLHHLYLVAHDRNFSRNVIDQDGEGFEPWYADGSFLQINPNVSGGLRFGKNKLFEFAWQSENQIITHRPKTKNWQHTTYFQTDSISTTSLALYDFSSESNVVGLFKERVSLRWQQQFGDLSLRAAVTPTLDALITGENNIVSPNFEVDFELDYNVKRHFFIYAALYRRVMSYNYEQAKFLSHKHLNSDKFYWNDINNNLEVDEGEKGGLQQAIGGKTHFLASNLSQPHNYGFELALEGRFKQERIRFGMHGKMILNRKPLHVQYKDGILPNGSYQILQGDSIFILNDNQTVAYEVGNLSKTAVLDKTENDSKFFNQPFYAGVTAHLSYRSKKWLMFTSFTAYMNPGIGGAIGNGPYANSLNLLSESVASPNSLYKNYGRLDADRSYIAKLLATFTPSEKFSMAIQVKYIDGQPFNFYKSELVSNANGNDVIVWNNGIKGDNPFTGEFNTRTDGIWNLDVRMRITKQLNKGKLQFNIELSNIVDFGMALKEYNFQPAISSNRSALDLEIPRGLRLGIRYLM